MRRLHLLLAEVENALEIDGVRELECDLEAGAVVELAALLGETNNKLALTVRRRQRRSKGSGSPAGLTLPPSMLNWVTVYTFFLSVSLGTPH